MLLLDDCWLEVSFPKVSWFQRSDYVKTQGGAKRQFRLHLKHLLKSANKQVAVIELRVVRDDIEKQDESSRMRVIFGNPHVPFPAH